MVMSRLFIAAILMLATSAAYADDTCKTKAADKKLAGAALASFSKKCAKDAQTACDTQAGEKKLYGAAKSSFVKKCVKDSVGD